MHIAPWSKGGKTGRDNLQMLLSHSRILLGYDSSSFYMKELDRYNYSHGNNSTLTKAIAESWAKHQAGKSTSQEQSWIPPIREFGRYLQNLGHQDAYVLDDRFKIQHYHAEVYLTTKKEIQAFFRNCDTYVLHCKVLGRPHVFPVLYRFLYCCGVRCGKACKLKCQDEHLDKGYVDILYAKAHRNRRLYLSEELVKYLMNYDRTISKVFPEREYLLPGGHGNICSPSAVSPNFRNIWLSAGLRRDGKVKPRAYDFRHHFACANIMRWSSEGKDIHAMFPYMMRYMGHSSLESTY